MPAKGTKQTKEAKAKVAAAKIGNKHALGNTGGRPSEYDESYPEKVLEYLKKCVDEYKSLLKSENAESGSITYANQLAVSIPQYADVCIMLDCSYETMNAWAALHPEFARALRAVKMEQEKRLVNKGLSGEYVSPIVKMLLSANHGYREKTEVDLTGSVTVNNINTLNDEQLERIANGG